jgi:hypothetical protein
MYVPKDETNAMPQHLIIAQATLADTIEELQKAQHDLLTAKQSIIGLDAVVNTLKSENDRLAKALADQTALTTQATTERDALKVNLAAQLIENARYARLNDAMQVMNKEAEHSKKTK